MQAMTNRKAEIPTVDPDEEFSDPAELMERQDLSNEDKIKVLESWQSDLVQLLKAVEENMPGGGTAPDDTAARLARVTAALTKLKERKGAR
jgi:hypothetical protein